MSKSRSLLGPGILAGYLFFCLADSCKAQGQPADQGPVTQGSATQESSVQGFANQGPAGQRSTQVKRAVSPVAPGDLSKPVFDTTTPIYSRVPGLDKSASTIIAEVEGRPITLGDVGDAIRALPPALSQLPFEALYPGIVEQLIKQQALVVRAQEQGVDEDPVIRRRVKAAADRALANEYLHRETDSGITEARLLERYNRDVAGRPGADEVRARIILVPTEKEAQDLIAELRGGADFAVVARRASKDPTAVVGGDLGFNTRDGLTAEIGAVAFALPAGQLAPYPVRGSGAWFVVKAEERRRQATPGFTAMREALTQALSREGVIPLTTAALNAVTVREYNITGKEVEADKGNSR
jgi:peptidyl-prolyl cis-trans isomerase C